LKLNGADSIASLRAVGEPHPSKQGLKLVTVADAAADAIGRRAPSIKTRIETATRVQASGLQSIVGEPHPSKQGLKPERPADGTTSGLLSASPIHQNKD